MGRRKKGDKINGWLNIYKPRGIGSTDVVNKTRRLLNAQKAGHAGTLDPLAEGILPVAFGEATKTIPYMQNALKTYRFDLVWGEARNTDDAEGEVTKTCDIRPSEKEIRAVLPEFTGQIEQVPPAFSAIKVDGQRAYALARKGETVELAARCVTIESIHLLSAEKDKASFEVVCGKGTYIRSLGRDIAQKLGTVGYIDQLLRASVGTFTEKDAILLDNLEALLHKEGLQAVLWACEAGLDDIPDISFTQAEAVKLKQGQSLTFFSKADSHRLDGLDLGEDGTALAMVDDMAIGLVSVSNVTIRPKKLFNL